MGLRWDKHCICYTLSDVNKVIDQKVKYASLKYFMLSVGCNDLDHNDAINVFDDLKKIVTKLQTLYPHIKIIVGEITPQMDSKDELVKEINILINEYAVSKDNMYIIRNSNMRHKKFFYPGDSKHIRRDCIGRYAANIKHTLRVAYGRQRYVPPTQQSSRSSPIPQPVQQQHYPHYQQQQILNQLQLQNLISLLFPAHLSNSSSSERPWITQRLSDSRAVDLINGGVT